MWSRSTVACAVAVSVSRSTPARCGRAQLVGRSNSEQRTEERERGSPRACGARPTGPVNRDLGRTLVRAARQALGRVPLIDRNPMRPGEMLIARALLALVASGAGHASRLEDVG